LLSNLKFKFIEKVTFDKLSSDNSLSMVVIEHLNNYMIERLIEYMSERNRKLGSAEKYGRLYEAHTGLGQYYKRHLWYLARPLYNTDYNPDLYFEIVKNGCNYLIMEDEIVVYRPN